MKGFKLFKFLIIFFWLIFFIVLNLKSSIFLNKKERVNLVFYGPKTVVYSLSLNNDLTYLIYYPVNLSLLVPGGYGFYRVGALGKLIFLEKEPNLFKRIFSASNSFFIDLYFYPKKDEIYFDEKNDKKIWPTLTDLFFNQSNANFIDRLLTFYYLWLKKPSFYQTISISNQKKFDQNDFFKKNIGTFYKKIYRQENLTIQILYNRNYQTAKLLAQILEGEGIRVVDLSQKKLDSNKPCAIITALKTVVQTVKDIRRFFSCDFRTGATSVSDIIINLGKLEKDWEVGN
jgi:hypothetical protein